MKKQLLVDCNSIVFRRGMTHLPGIGRTTMDVLLAIQASGSLSFDITMLTLTIRGDLPEALFSLRRRNIPLPSGRFFDWTIEQFPLLEGISRYDLLHIPHN